MEDAKFIERFRDVGRPGFYCRVIVEGDVHAGDAVFREDYGGERVTVVELFQDHFASLHPEAALRRYLTAPLSERLRREKVQQLQGTVALS
jgi:MOSC domain-containing protein YiiM